MKIVIPTVDYPPIEGGIGTLALRLSRELAALGHEVTVIAPRLGDMTEHDEAEPCSVVRFGGYRLGWLRIVPLWLASRQYVRNADAVIGINVGYGGVIGRSARRNLGIPFLAFAYAYEFMKFAHAPLIGRLLRSVYANARAVIAISHYTRERLEAFGAKPGNIRVVFPGAATPRPVALHEIDEVRRRHALGDGPIVLSVGRLIQRKNHIALVRAMPRILASVPNAILVIVGQGRETIGLARVAHELRVRDHVHLPGKVADEELARLYAAASVFALTPREAAGGHVEGFGLVYAEAHAYGVPVVASRCGGVEEAVIDNETGLFANPDDPDTIADAIIRLLTDRGLAEQLGSAGKSRVDRELNWTHFAKRVAECLEADA